MPHLDGFRFRRLLRAMDAEGFERFVADCWRARGWTVEREGNVLVASKPGRGERLTLDVRAVPWWRPGSPTAATTEADRLVLDRPVPDAPDWVVDADDLREALSYAVDPATRADLLADHLARAGPLAGWAVQRAPPARRLATVALALGAAALVVVAAALAFPPGAEPAVDGEEAAGATTPVESIGDPATPSEFAATQWPGGGGGYPAGLGESGVTDPAALAATHVGRAGARAYELRLSVREFEGDRPVGSYDERIRVASDWRFVTSVAVEGDLSDGHPAIARAEVYTEGNGLFVHLEPVRGLHRQAALAASPGDVVGLENRVERYLGDVLSVERSTVVETTQIGDTTIHRVNGTGPGPDGSERRVSVLVTAGGTIHEVRVARSQPGEDRRVVATLEYTYGPVVVDPPAWVHDDSVTAGRNLPLSKR